MSTQVIREQKSYLNHLRSAGGFFISAFFLWLTFRNIDYRSFNVIPNENTLTLFVVSMIVLIVSVWVQSIRMKFFWLSKHKKWNDIHTYDSLIIGNFYNCIVPGNLGEGAKAWHLSRKNNLSFMNSLAGLISEKWIDAHIFIGLGLFFLIVIPFQNHFIYHSIIGMMAIISGLLLIYFLMQKYRKLEKSIWKYVVMYKKAGIPLFKTYIHVKNFQDHLFSGNRIIYYCIVALTAFLFNMVQYYILLIALDIPDTMISITTAYIVSLSMVVILAVPSAPGSIGVMHFGVYSALILVANYYEISLDSNLLQTFALYTVYIHFSCFIPEVLLGIIYVIKERNLLFTGKEQF